MRTDPRALFPGRGASAEEHKVLLMEPAAREYPYPQKGFPKALHARPASMLDPTAEPPNLQVETEIPPMSLNLNLHRL